jgi:hypothetical protein
MTKERYMGPESFEEQLEEKYPQIAWRKPLHIAAPQGKGLACRFCIARYGLRTQQIPALPQNVAEFHAHMKDFHPLLQPSN